MAVKCALDVIVKGGGFLAIVARNPLSASSWFSKRAHKYLNRHLCVQVLTAGKNTTETSRNTGHLAAKHLARSRISPARYPTAKELMATSLFGTIQHLMQRPTWTPPPSLIHQELIEVTHSCTDSSDSQQVSVQLTTHYEEETIPERAKETSPASRYI